MQRFVRRVWAYREARVILEELRAEAIIHAAAATIQSQWKGRKVRRQWKDMIKVMKAKILVIQRVWRGRKVEHWRKTKLRRWGM